MSSQLYSIVSNWTSLATSTAPALSLTLIASLFSLVLMKSWFRSSRFNPAGKVSQEDPSTLNLATAVLNPLENSIATSEEVRKGWVSRWHVNSQTEARTLASHRGPNRNSTRHSKKLR